MGFKKTVKKSTKKKITKRKVSNPLSFKIPKFSLKI